MIISLSIFSAVLLLVHSVSSGDLYENKRVLRETQEVESTYKFHHPPSIEKYIPVAVVYEEDEDEQLSREDTEQDDDIEQDDDNVEDDYSDEEEDDDDDDYDITTTTTKAPRFVRPKPRLANYPPSAVGSNPLLKPKGRAVNIPISIISQSSTNTNSNSRYTAPRRLPGTLFKVNKVQTTNDEKTETKSTESSVIQTETTTPQVEETQKPTESAVNIPISNSGRSSTYSNSNYRYKAPRRLPGTLFKVNKVQTTNNEKTETNSTESSVIQTEATTPQVEETLKSTEPAENIPISNSDRSSTNTNSNDRDKAPRRFSGKLFKNNKVKTTDDEKIETKPTESSVIQTEATTPQVEETLKSTEPAVNIPISNSDRSSTNTNSNDRDKTPRRFSSKLFKNNKVQSINYEKTEIKSTEPSIIQTEATTPQVVKTQKTTESAMNIPISNSGRSSTYTNGNNRDKAPRPLPGKLLKINKVQTINNEKSETKPTEPSLRIEATTPKLVKTQKTTESVPKYTFKKRTEGRDPVVPIIESDNFVSAFAGDYHYSYEGGDGKRVFEKGVLKPADGRSSGGVVGGFSYTDKDGNDFSLSYTADENGYRPVGAHLPTPPPIPIAIQRALEYLATKTTPEPITERVHKFE